MNWLLDLDRALFLEINDLIGDYPPLDAAVRLLVNEYFVPVTLALGLLFLWFGARSSEERERWQRAVVVAAIAVGVANVMVKVSNLIWFRDRPFHNTLIDMLFYKPIDSSFPANSAAVALAIAVGVWLNDRRAARPFWGPAVLLPASRLIAGVHYPLDILGGAVFGIVAALAAQQIARAAEPVILRLLFAMRRVGVA